MCFVPSPTKVAALPKASPVHLHLSHREIDRDELEIGVPDVLVGFLATSTEGRTHFVLTHGNHETKRTIDDFNAPISMFPLHESLPLCRRDFKIVETLEYRFEHTVAQNPSRRGDESQSCCFLSSGRCGRQLCHPSPPSNVSYPIPSLPPPFLYPDAEIQWKPLSRFSALRQRLPCISRSWRHA